MPAAVDAARPRLGATGCATLASWPRVRQAHLAQCRTLLGHAMPPCSPAAAVDRQAPDVSAAEPGSVCPVCQHGRMQRITTVYRQPAVWDLSVPAAPGLHVTMRRQTRQPQLGALTAGLDRLEGRGAPTMVAKAS